MVGREAPLDPLLLPLLEEPLLPLAPPPPVPALVPEQAASVTTIEAKSTPLRIFTMRPSEGGAVRADRR